MYRWGRVGFQGIWAGVHWNTMQCSETSEDRIRVCNNDSSHIKIHQCWQQQTLQNASASSIVEETKNMNLPNIFHAFSNNCIQNSVGLERVWCIRQGNIKTRKCEMTKRKMQLTHPGKCACYVILQHWLIGTYFFLFLSLLGCKDIIGHCIAGLLSVNIINGWLLLSC